MKVEVKATESIENPACLITIKTGWKIVDLIIKPKLFFKDIDNTFGKWMAYLDENNTRQTDQFTEDYLDDMVLEKENKNDVEYVSDLVSLFEEK